MDNEETKVEDTPQEETPEEETLADDDIPKVAGQFLLFCLKKTSYLIRDKLVKTIDKV